MRLLLIQPGAIGDFLVALPSISWLKQKLKPTWLEIWTERANLPLAQSPALADRAVALADTRFHSYPIPYVVLERLRQFDLVVSWSGFGDSACRQAVLQAHPRAYFLPALQQDSDCHAMEFRRSQVMELFGTEANFPPYPTLELSEEDSAFGRGYLARQMASGKPIVVFHPGASHVRKRWPTENFTAVISHLQQQNGIEILLCEGPLERGVCEGIVGGLPPETDRCAATVRIENLGRLAAVLRHCNLYVGNDSGIAHLAAALGTPTLAVFTATDPKVWAPRGPQVKVLVRPTVDELHLAINSALSAKQTSYQSHEHP
jgi:ADP-heptose:LPS heptosyltransferase